MPPATATARVSLRELADLAIGTPEVGAVNFTALHTLIVAMLRSLNLQEVRINFQSPSPESSRSSELPRTVLSAPQLAVPKEKPRSSSARPPALESQVKDLSKQLKTVTSQVQGIMGHVQHLTYPVGRLPVDSQDWLEEEMAVLLPDRARGGSMKIGKDGEQDGERASVTKATVLLHDVAEDVKALKEAKEKAQEHSEKAFQRMDELEKIIRERDKFLDLVGRKLSLMPVGEEVTMVTWEELEQAITDGWRASQAGSETTMGLLKRKKHTSLTSDDGASTKHSSADPTVDSAHGHGSDRTLSGISATGYPSEGVGREQKKSTPTTASPGREQHPRARDEAGVAKSRHPSVSQFRLESDRHRTRELQPHTSAYLRKDEREAHPGLVQQDLPSATAIRDQHPRVYPDQHGGVHVRYGQIYPRPDQHGIAPLGTDQLASLNHSTYPHSVVPLSMGQLGMMPPGMDEQGSVLPGMDQRGMMPPLVPGRDQRGLQLPSTDQPGMVPFSTYQHGMTFPGTDQQPDVAQRGLVPLHVDQHGFLISGMDQQGLALPGMDQHGLVPHLIAQHGLGPTGTDQNALVQPGLVQPGMDQRGLVQPVVDERGLVQPGAYLPDWVRPGAYATGWVQPGAYPLDLVYPDVYPSGLVRLGADQPGLMQPGLGQQDSVQPGMDQYNLGQPGMDQRGLVQLGMDQHGLVQPGTVQPGLVQPGAAQPGLVQPGAAQPGLVQPGVGQPGLVQPGAAQPGLVQPGVGQPGLVQPGAGQPSLVQPGMDLGGLVQPGMDQRVLAQPGAAQPGLVPPGAGQPGVVQPGMDQRGSAQPGSAQPGLVQPATSQYGLAQPGARQPGLVQPQMGQPALVQPGAGQPGAGQPGLVQPGMDRRGLVYPGADQGGLVQPGAGQPDLVQPGAGQPGLVQRGVGQRGLVEPGTGPRGVFQPGAYPPGVLQPGAYLPSSVEPGAYPQGLVPPGAYPRGLVQPGALPRGFMQPLTDQRGLRQPGRDQQGSIPSSTELRGFPAFHPESLRFISPHPYQHGVMPPSRGQHGRVSPLLSGQGLAPPGTDQEGLSETYQPGVIHPGTDQGGQIKPGADQHDQSYSIPESRDLTYPGPRGPGFPGADQLQVSVDPQQTYTSDRAGISVRTTPSQEATFAKSTVFLNDLYRASSERVDIQSERHDSLDKLSPSFPIAVETFRLMGELIGLYVELKENMKELDEEKAGQTDLEKLQYLLSLMVKKTIPPDLHEQLKTLKALTKEVRQERAKLDKIQRLLEGEREQEIGKEMKDDQLSTQLGILRVTVADIEKELAELRESQERGKVSMEHSVSEASLYLQDQLDKLRTIIESMLASSSTLLSMSMTPRKILTASAPSQIDPETTCPACSLDLGHQVSMLVQRYEQLQDMVTNLAATRPSKKAKLQSQDEELLGHIQSAILQVQGDCEKLNITTGSLIEDHRQKQKDIDVLYQGLEKLEKEKANREHLEMEIDVKADKSALEAKVSRVQFDATTEQLNHMMQELTSKMSGQERDWQKMLDKLLVEMDSKLDRLELDPVKQLLEDRWKALRQQLKERPPLYQADEAAAMRKQLLAHFHCLSCDRPLETPVTGQIIPVIPMGPGLPGHRSIRPYTVFELEQVRQQSRNLKLGCAPFPRGDLAHTERSVGRLRTMHSKMLMDIEKVQIHFGGSVKASSQMIRELLQAQCLSSPCHRRVPDMADYTYSSAPRRCGGSHTLTYPYRRNRLQHLSQGMYPTEEIQIAMKHDEVDILGLDGHIYKGRIDTRLPGIPSKDTPVSASGMTKHKAKQPRPHTHRQQSVSVSSQLPSRPQSAQMLAGNNSGSFPLAGASFQVAPPLPSSPGASPPCPAGPLSGPGLVAALNSLERRIAWELREGMGGRREKIVLTEFSTHASSFPSAQRQTRLLRGAPLPAECGPPAQPQRDGKPASGCGRAPGCPAGGGSRGAHPGAEVHHCSLSKATNKCLGRSLGQRGFSGLGSGRWGGKGGAPAGQAPPDCPQVRGRGASLGEPGMTCSLGIRPRPPHPTDEAALQGLQEG
ncbi:glutamine-rich protein 2 isoform X10 [Acinonyx jubatus]|uniref:Glutamine-rich protein 2 isoform X10 n=1 Tax=Acinonyx jubatus TaxID=32536 RepID=A0ABM3PA42_ACIJB|nr:glutamine-rich protein 2 isoform X10 [Acinonyx jubatus]